MDLFIPRLTAAACLAAALPAAAQALPEVVVRARAPGQSPSTTLPGIEAATERIERVPGGASVVDTAPLRDQKTSNLTDALSYTAGVFAQARFGQDEARLSIRGSGLQRTFHLRGIKLLQDGVPLNQADGGGDFQAADPLAARYIEVYRGANALRYGATTLGGAINLVSPTGHDFAGPELRAEAGSFGYRRLQAAAGGVSGPLDYAVSVSDYREDGFRAQSRTDNQRLFGNVGWRVSDRLETRFFLSYIDSESQLPGTLTRAQLQADPRQANPASLSGNQQRDFTLARLANRTVYRWNNAQLELGVFAAHKSLYHPIFQLLNVDSDDYGLVARLTGFGQLLGRPQRWIVGFEPQATRQTDRRNVNLAGRPGAPTGDSLQTATNVDLYGESQTDLTDRFTLVVGAQATRSARRFEDRFLSDGVDNSFDRRYTRVSPKLGFLYWVADDATVFGNLSGAFEPPSFGELAGGPNITPLRAQRARSAELGTRGRTGWAGWELVAYRAAVRDELLSLNDARGQLLGTVNAGRTLHQGIELAATAAPPGWPQMRAAYLLQDFRFQDHPVYGNNRLPGLPRQFLRAQALFAAPAGVRFGPTLEWSPQRYPVDMANTLFVDSYAIWGLRATGPIGADASWFVEARNLSDRRYAASSGVIADARGADSAQFLPGTGRSVYAGVRVAFR